MENKLTKQDCANLISFIDRIEAKGLNEMGIALGLANKLSLISQELDKKENEK